MRPGDGSVREESKVLGCDPAASPAELKRAYHEKLREYHPDKRPETPGDTGARVPQTCSVEALGLKVTQAVLDAWSVLQDAEKRRAYDAHYQEKRSQHMAKEIAEASKKLDFVLVAGQTERRQRVVQRSPGIEMTRT